MGWEFWGLSVGCDNILLYFPKLKPASFQSVPRLLSLVVKPPGLETDHSSPISAEAKNEWNFIEYFPHMHPWLA
jgi:hypothetical protein